MSISDWQLQALRVEPLGISDVLVGSAPLVAVSLPPVRESADVELGARLAHDLAALTRVLLGPQLPLVELPEPVAAVEVPPVAVPAVEDFVPPPLPPEVEPLFVAPPVVEVEPLVPPGTPIPVPATRPNRSILAELAFLDD